MNKEVTIEKILRSFLTVEVMLVDNPDYTYNMVLSAMREACKQTLELAAENAKISIQYIGEDGLEITNTLNSVFDKNYLIDKQSILDTINQIK